MNEEFRCTEETAMTLMKRDTTRPALTPPFGTALGIPIKVSDAVPEGKIQFWQDGKLIMEVNI